MKRAIGSLILLVALSWTTAIGQTRYFTKSGTVSFDASGTMEDILAENKKATFVLDAKSGAVELAILLKAFEFERALMQEHFNENY
ncbi:MAG: YceI family protein, partial [Ignavibacteriota bacterium]